MKILFRIIPLLLMALLFFACQLDQTQDILTPSAEEAEVKGINAYGNWSLEHGDIIAIQSHANGKWVTAGSQVIANSSSINLEQKFQVEALGDGKIALKALGANRYVCSPEPRRYWEWFQYKYEYYPLVADRTEARSWETFTYQVNSDNSLSLRSNDTGKWVCAENNGSSPLYANRDGIGVWEKFNVHFVYSVQLSKAKGYLETIDLDNDKYKIHLEGDAYEMGYQHGYLLAETISYSYSNEFFVELVLAFIDSDFLEELTQSEFVVNTVVGMVGAFALIQDGLYIDDEIEQELQGIVDGARNRLAELGKDYSSITYTRALLLNSAFDILLSIGYPIFMYMENNGSLPGQEEFQAIIDAINSSTGWIVDTAQDIKDKTEEAFQYIKDAAIEAGQSIENAWNDVVGWFSLAPEAAPYYADFLRQRHACDGFIATGSATTTGFTFSARNFMITPSITNITVLMEYQPDNGYKFAAYNMPGFVGTPAAMNETGLSIGMDMLPCINTKPASTGLGTLLIARKIMQYQNTVDGAFSFINNQPRGVPWIYNVASPTDGAIIEAGPDLCMKRSLDYTYDESQSLDPYGIQIETHPEIAVLTNHFIIPEIQSSSQSYFDHGSIVRQYFLTDLVLEYVGAIDFELTQAIVLYRNSMPTRNIFWDRDMYDPTDGTYSDNRGGDPTGNSHVRGIRVAFDNANKRMTGLWRLNKDPLVGYEF